MLISLALNFLVYLQDNIAGRSVIDAHFGRHHHHIILSDVEARRAQAISAKQKFKKVFCITTPLSVQRCNNRLENNCSLISFRSFFQFVRLPFLLAFAQTLSLCLALSLSLSRSRTHTHTHTHTHTLSLSLSFSLSLCVCARVCVGARPSHICISQYQSRV
jgi:hypothetical protein